MLPHVESYAFFSTWAEKGVWKNDLTIRRYVARNTSRILLMTVYSLEGIKSYFPGCRIHRISPTPLLMQAPGKDVIATTETMLEAYSRAIEPKELQMLPGGHFSMFEGDVFEMLLAKEIDFLKRTLLE